MKKSIIKSFIAILLAFAMILPTCFVAFAAGGGGGEKPKKNRPGNVIYYDFKTITDVSNLTADREYMFLAAEYKDKEAVVDIPNGSAILEYKGLYNESVKYLDTRYNPPEEHDYFGKVMFYADGTKMAQGSVIVAEAGTGFDNCPAGTIAYVSDDDVKAAIDAKKISKEYNISYEEYCTKYADTLENDYNSIIESMNTNPDYYDDYIEWFFDGKEPTLDNYCAYQYSLAMEDAIEISAGRVSWRYGCDGGGVCCVGPFYLCEFKSKEFTADDIGARMKDGYDLPKEPTEVTPEQVVVTITIDGEVYDVPYFTIDPENNTLSTNNNDLTIDVVVGSIKKTVTVQPAKSKQADIPTTPGTITNITQSDMIDDPYRPIFNTNLVDTPDYIQQALNITDEQKANGVNVWLECRDVSESVPAEEKAAIEKSVADKLGADAKIAMYLDAELFYKETGKDTVQIHETSKEITISFVVPDSLINTDGRLNREYALVRYHNGAADIITGKFDPATKTLTFTSDKFSTYALVYYDEAIANTADTTPIALVASSCVLAAAGFVFTKKKNREF